MVLAVVKTKQNWMQTFSLQATSHTKNIIAVLPGPVMQKLNIVCCSYGHVPYSLENLWAIFLNDGLQT